jgi:hypothetical protein
MWFFVDKVDRIWRVHGPQLYRGCGSMKVLSNCRSVLCGYPPNQKKKKPLRLHSQQLSIQNPDAQGKKKSWMGVYFEAEIEKLLWMNGSG